MNSTTNLSLLKPEYSDDADISDINDNMDTLDRVIGAVPSGKTLQGQITENATDMNGKANKVSSPTSGNFAGLDLNGDITDSGSKASDFMPFTDVATTTETQQIITDYVG